MMKTGMLVISNPNIGLRSLLQCEISNTIYIQYFPSSKWNKHLCVKNSDTRSSNLNWPLYSSSVISIYSKMLPFKNVDVRVLLSGVKSQDYSRCITKIPMEVIYYDQFFSKEGLQKYITSCVVNKTSGCKVIAVPNLTNDVSEEYNNTMSPEKIYDSVVIGGTFDRLHYGHKILLSEAVLRCRKKVTVGVTDTNMLKGKKLWELVEPCEIRIKNVREFLEEVEPLLEYDIIPINDIFGPTKDDPTFQMIVVSSETAGGGSKINELRAANQLNPLCIHQVELLADINKEDEEEEDKISSSNLRLRCLGTLIKAPQPNPNIPVKPYIVGLTGGIASGKTNITKYLADLGAGIVNCDQIGHHIYRPGSAGYDKVVKQFGLEILDKEGAIDRKKLGAIVFNDKEKMHTLNQLVWPLILEEALLCARKLNSEGHEVVVLEAAVLISAGWTAYCHEIWVSIIPSAEAVNRVMSRNNLTEEEATARVSAQPTNTEQVKQANVVFSTLWRREFTQKQVTKAWTSLKERLNMH